MSVLALGLNYRTAPVALLERLAVPAELLGKALASLVGREHVSEAVVLSTCNRVEVYARVSRYHGGIADIRDFFCEWGGFAPEDLDDRTFDYFEESAARHLFAVASGLDSMVVGERQIALQVKQSFADAEAEGSVGRVLGALFRQALRVGRRTRTETRISDGASSMVDVGLEAACATLDDLEGRTVLLVGAGKMGGMAASRLTHAGADVSVANRTADKAERLAARVNGRVVAMSDLASGMTDADLVVTSTGAAMPLIDAETVEAAVAARPDRPLVLLDLAVPRDVEPACADVPGVTVLDVDDVRRVTDAGATGEEVAKAAELVAQEAAAFTAWTRAVRVEPTIAALRARAEGVRLAETERLAKRLADLDDRQRAAVEALTKGIVNTLLHQPSVRLKDVADHRGGEEHAATLRELFDLPDLPEQ